jgi:hypothetical protein
MASHNLNDMSSRSHAMLSIQIEQDLQGYDDPKEQITRQGKLVFVDLAGIQAFPFRLLSHTLPFSFQAVKELKSVIPKANNLSKQIISIKVYSLLVKHHRLILFKHDLFFPFRNMYLSIK